MVLVLIVDIDTMATWWPLLLQDNKWKTMIHDTQEQSRLAAIQDLTAFKLSFCAWLLLYHQFPRARFIRAPSGRPALKDAPEVMNFNIAHDGHYSVFAHDAALQYVGIDVVSMKFFWSENEKNDYAMMKRSLFTQAEQQWIGESQTNFYIMWAVKEALFKATGEGLGASWQEREVMLKHVESGVLEFTVLRDNQWRVQVQKIDGDTILAVATKPHFTDFTLQLLAAENLLPNNL